MKLTLPDHVLRNSDLSGHCSVEGKRAPRIIAFRGGCNVEILKTEKNLIHSLVYFVVKNVTRTCKYQCFLFRSTVKKTVSVVGMSVFAACIHTYVKVYLSM